MEPSRESFYSPSWGILLLLLFSPFLLRKRNVPIVSNGRIVAVAKRPLPWSGNEVGVYADGTKIFSLWADTFDFPVYVYPFGEGEKFLCIYDDDTSVPVFVVDLNTQATNIAAQSGWPPDGYTRNYLAQRATNCVVETKGRVRLPTCSEVQEAAQSIAKMSPGEIRRTSFPATDFGVWRFYWLKQAMLNAVATNRHSVWP
jgi:hypothetical protein